MKVDYRADVDVLRALAVSSVILFHLEFSRFSGGFVGVDVFFVISGYLITTIIFSEVKQGAFSFITFYERRVRRILPALYFLICVTLIAGWFLLLPTDYLSLSQSASSVILFSSNFLFWQDSGYFDRPALTKPLLHTWSLAVEEQYYIIYPIVIYAIFWLKYFGRRGRAGFVGVTAALALGSLLVSVWSVKYAPNAAFYLPFGRAFELLIGSLLALLNPRPPASVTIRLTAFAVGIILVVSPIVLFSNTTPFPGLAALVPCLGAALYLWSNSSQLEAYPRTILAPAIFIGRISYSLYLWHWPIIVFARQILSPEIWERRSTKIELIALAMIAASISYYCVEQPFRHRKVGTTRPTLFAEAAGASCLFLVFFGLSQLSNGFGLRIDDKVRSIEAYLSYDKNALYRVDQCFIELGQPFSAFDKNACIMEKGALPKLLVWGDSIAAHYVPGFIALTKGHADVEQITASSCPPFFDLEQAVVPNCKPLNDFVREWLPTHKPDAVLISAHWFNYRNGLGYDRMRDMLRTTIAFLDAHKIPVILFGPSIQYREELPIVIARLSLRGAKSEVSPFLQREIFALDQRMNEDFGRASGVRFVSILSSICPAHRCPAFASSDVPMNWDTIHLTAEGSNRVVDAVAPTLESAFPWLGVSSP